MTGRTPNGRRKSASRRVAWPESDRPEGGEFRLTWPRIAIIAAVLAAIPSIWAIGGHYMNKDEIEKAISANKADADRVIAENKADTDRVMQNNKLDTDRVIESNKEAAERGLKDHVNHDNSQQAWNQYNLSAGLAANRVEYLDDKQAECDAKTMAVKVLAGPDKIICDRIAKKLQLKNQEVADLKAKAMETTKEITK